MYFTRLQGRNPVSFAIFAAIVKVLDQKNFLIKNLLLKFMAQFFFTFNFLKMTIFSGTL